MADEAANPRVVRQRLRGVVKDALQKHLEVLQAAEALSKSEMCKTAGCTGSLHKCAMRKDSLDTTASMPSSDLAMGEGVNDWKRAGVSGRLLEKVRASARHTGTAHTIGVGDPVRVAPSGALSLPGRSSAPMPLPKTEIAKAGIHDAKTVVSGKPRPTSVTANDWKPGTAVGSTSGSVSFPKRGLAAANLNAAPTRSWEKGEIAKAGPVVEEHDPDILHGIARGPYASSWMDHQQQNGHSLSGVDGYEAAPPTPQEALQWAHGVANHIVAANGGKSLAQLHQEAQAAGYPHDAGQFGYHLGMQHVGSGVGYSDDMPHNYRQHIQIPHGETPYFNFEPHSEPLKSAESTAKTDLAAVAHGVGTVVPAVRAAATGMVAALRARAKLGGIGKAEIKTGTVDTAPAKGAVLPGDKKPKIVGGKADDAGSGGDVEKGKSPLKKADILTDKDGKPFTKPDRKDFNARAFHEHKQKITNSANAGFDAGLKTGLKKDAADVAFGIPGSMRPKMPRTTPGLPGMTPKAGSAPIGSPRVVAMGGGMHHLGAEAQARITAADKKAAGVGLMASLITRFKGIGKRGWSTPSAHSSLAGATRAMGRRMAMAEKPDAPAEFEVGAKIRQKSTGRTGTVRHVTGLPGARRHKIVPDDGGAPQTWESHDMEHAEPIKKAGTLPAGPAAAPKVVASTPKTPAAGPKGPRMKTTGGAGPA